MALGTVDPWSTGVSLVCAACPHPSVHSSLGAPGCTLTSCLPARLALLTVLPCPGAEVQGLAQASWLESLQAFGAG